MKTRAKHRDRRAESLVNGALAIRDKHYPAETPGEKKKER